MRIEIIFNEDTRWTVINNMAGDPAGFDPEEYDKWVNKKHELSENFFGPIFENVQKFFYEHGFFNVLTEDGVVYSYNTNTINRIRFGDRN